MMLMNETNATGKLLGNVCRTHATKADQMLDQVGIYRGQAFLLMLLSKNDGLTHSEISEHLQISPAAVTKVIKRLEQMDFIQRKPDDVDERVSRVFMQEKGRVKINEVHSILKTVDQIMLKDISEEDIQTLRELLLRMQKNMIDSMS